MKHYTIIVAGGKGKRMQSDLPKQFVEIKGLPLLMHTIFLFYEFDPAMEIIVVLPAAQFGKWKELCVDYQFKIPHQLAEGGPERFHSVKNGLKEIPNENALVAIHDAVRPMVDKKVIADVFRYAGFYGNAIPVIPVSESLRERTGSGSKQIIRLNMVLVQTPQCFKADILKKAYQHVYREDFTDDASVVESDGVQIHLVNGNPENIKITTPGDLKIAEALLFEKILNH